MRSDLTRALECAGLLVCSLIIAAALILLPAAVAAVLAAMARGPSWQAPAAYYMTVGSMTTALGVAAWNHWKEYTNGEAFWTTMAVDRMSAWQKVEAAVPGAALAVAALLALLAGLSWY